MKDDPEYEAVKHTAEKVWDRESVVFGLARLVETDVTNTIEAIQGAKYKGVHTFVGTSPEHLSTFSFWTDEILKNIWQRVSQIRNAWCIAQFSAEDATRTEMDLLLEVYEKASEAGAQILNIPDTLWYYDVEQYLKLLEHLRQKFPHLIISTHTHNDKSQAEQSALIGVSKWFAQRVEWTIYGIWERAWNADIMSIIAIILQDPQYKHLAEKLIKNPDWFVDVLDYMTEISGIHTRPVSPMYWFEAIVNRSWVHQAKVAQLKASYIAYPWNELWLWDRPQIEISALSGVHGVVSHFKKYFNIDLNDTQAKKMTAVLRNAFSPDTTPDSMHTTFPDISSDFFYGIWTRISAVRTEARAMKNTKENLIKWNRLTDDIINEIYDEIYWEE